MCVYVCVPVRGLRAPKREVCVFPPVVLHLQSLTDPAPWGSAKSPSNIEMYNMARLEHGDQVSTLHPNKDELLWSLHEPLSDIYLYYLCVQILWSGIGILSTPPERGDLYLPSCGNSEFTRASSGVRHSEENKSQEEGGGPAGKTTFKHTISMSLFTALTHTHTDITTTLLHCCTVVVRLRVIHIIITVPLPVNSGSLTSFLLFSLQINMIQKIISLSCYWEIAK